MSEEARRVLIDGVLLEVVGEVAEPRDHLEPDQLLVEHLGLRSLDLARIVATLEMELDLDPFSQLVPITSVRTVGDLYEAYRLAAAPVEEQRRSLAEEPAAPRARRDEARRRSEVRARARGEA